ncbi:MAG: hypothetical protein DRR19_28755 [Candidatus Parabeggiatoa sp. nov. 1]|nr:MAG: hypothetical protein DRR19_28755 [Gammaproteobacteria bacterium]
MVSGTIIGTFAVLSMTNVAAGDLQMATGLSVPTVPAFTTQLPMLFGSVHADCKPINVGTGGWSCKKTATGVYQIRLKPSLPNIPVCQAAATATKADAPAYDNVFTTHVIGKTEFVVESIDVAANGKDGWAYQDASFSFICMWMP